MPLCWRSQYYKLAGGHPAHLEAPVLNGVQVLNSKDEELAATAYSSSETLIWSTPREVPVAGFTRWSGKPLESCLPLLP